MGANGRRQDDSGQAAVLVVGLLVVSLSVIGLAFDMARAFAERAALRARADQAALAATSALEDDALREGRLALDAADAKRRALSVLGRSGLGDGARAEVALQDGAVVVRVRATVPTVFLRLIGLPEMEVGASATAVPAVARR